MYCSNACKQRAKRALAKLAADADGAAATQNVSRLGKETTEFPTPRRPAETSAGAKRDTDVDAARSDAARLRKAARYSRRRTLWRITGDVACKGCGRALMDPSSGVIVAQTAAGTSVVLGLMRCGRIWLCPVCAATIRHKRAEEITAAVVEWIKRGGTAYLVTFTARHASKDRLADLMDALQGTRKTPDTPRRPGAYQRLITGGTWAGRPERGVDGIRDRIGYVGMIRATEVTVGQAHGWHPHIHAIVLVGGRTTGEKRDKTVAGTFTPTEASLAEWEDHWRTTWTRTLKAINPKFRPTDDCERADCSCGGKGHGVDFKRLHTERDANDLAEYIAKTQDGKSPALELARGDLKTAAGENVTPFQLLGRIGDLTGGVPEDDAAGCGSLEWNLARWHEYERATKGRRAIEWTRYLRQMLGLDGGDTEDDDLDLLLAADADGGELRAGVAVTETGWHAVTKRALDLAATEAAEGTDGNTDPDAMASRVRDVLALADVADTVVVLGPQQVADAYAEMLESLARRREEAAARRRREAENDGDQDDAEARQEHARNHIARLSGATGDWRPKTVCLRDQVT
ncbi:transposase [Streptomyces sp. NPDC059063]|uniref:transposase n=1 Tax=unclassified Streptomyces TaxID=2593676 RepID=UPI0036CE7852